MDMMHTQYFVLTFLVVMIMIKIIKLYTQEGSPMKTKIKKIVVQKREGESVKINCQRMQCRTTHKRKDC